jgi:hypothetical protein
MSQAPLRNVTEGQPSDRALRIINVLTIFLILAALPFFSVYLRHWTSDSGLALLPLLVFHVPIGAVLSLVGLAVGSRAGGCPPYARFVSLAVTCSLGLLFTVSWAWMVSLGLLVLSLGAAVASVLAGVGTRPTGGGTPSQPPLRHTPALAIVACSLFVTGFHALFSGSPLDFMVLQRLLYRIQQLLGASGRPAQTGAFLGLIVLVLWLALVESLSKRDLSRALGLPSGVREAVWGGLAVAILAMTDVVASSAGSPRVLLESAAALPVVAALPAALFKAALLCAATFGRLRRDAGWPPLLAAGFTLGAAMILKLGGLLYVLREYRTHILAGFGSGLMIVAGSLAVWSVSRGSVTACVVCFLAWRLGDTTHGTGADAVELLGGALAVAVAAFGGRKTREAGIGGEATAGVVTARAGQSNPG